MKKFFRLFLIALMSIVLVGCGNPDFKVSGDLVTDADEINQILEEKSNNDESIYFDETFKIETTSNTTFEGGKMTAKFTMHYQVTEKVEDFKFVGTYDATVNLDGEKTSEKSTLYINDGKINSEGSFSALFLLMIGVEDYDSKTISQEAYESLVIPNLISTIDSDDYTEAMKELFPGININSQQEFIDALLELNILKIYLDDKKISYVSKYDKDNLIQLFEKIGVNTSDLGMDSIKRLDVNETIIMLDGKVIYSKSESTIETNELDMKIKSTVTMESGVKMPKIPEF